MNGWYVKKFSSSYFMEDLFKIICQILGKIICWPLKLEVKNQRKRKGGKV